MFILLDSNEDWLSRTLTGIEYIYIEDMFELNKYEERTETNISICFLLMCISSLGNVLAWIGLVACAGLFGQLVYYPFWCKRKGESLFVPWWILYWLYGCVFVYGIVLNLVEA